MEVWKIKTQVSAFCDPAELIPGVLKHCPIYQYCLETFQVSGQEHCNVLSVEKQGVKFS